MPRKRRNFAFTLMELMVVISIIVLMLALSVPVVRSIEGSRSIETAYNRVSAALGHARQIALYYRAPAGIAIYPDLNDKNTLDISYVMQQSLIEGQTSLIATFISQGGSAGQIAQIDSHYVDIIPTEQTISLPSGIGAQIFNGNSATDRFLSAGVILFDQHGELATVPYWIGDKDHSLLGSDLKIPAPLGSPGAPPDLNGLKPTLTPPGVLYSHAAICLYDQAAYKGQFDPTTSKTFGDADALTNPMNTSIYATSGSSSPNTPYFGVSAGIPAASADKIAEGVWLSTNGEILVIKPNDGSLLKNK